MSNAGWSDPFPNHDKSRIYQRYITHSEEETKKIGYEFGRGLKPNQIICFFGNLGAGKTTFIKGLAAAVTGCSQVHVNSPTYVYLNIYEGDVKVFHFDLYRLHDVEEFLGMGFDEYFFSGGVCCLEWSEKIKAILPEDCIHIVLQAQEDHAREITLYM